MELTFGTKGDHKILSLLPYEDPLLRIQAQTLNFPLTDDEIELIENMLYSVEEPQLKAAKAPWPSAAGMAAPQWGFSKRIFVIRRNYIIQAKKDKNKFGGSDNFIVAINPEYLSFKDNQEEVMDTEGCFSVPNKSGTVRRLSKIKAKFQTIDGKKHSIIMEGWPARVFQHETDHTEGRLYDDPKAGRCSNLIDVFR